MRLSVSIIICTRNRAESLRPTLESIGRATVPAGWKVELLVVDNGSTDGTRQVTQNARFPNIQVRYILEPRPGQCHARNRGLSGSIGRAILFTDDDVRVPTNWIEGMCRPILDGLADAVAGSIRLAPHLERPWLKKELRAWLAATDETSKDPTLIGANMAFGRHVLAKVPAFDVELGPGALGFGDESLFSWQLAQAGYRLLRCDESVEHHFDPARLSEVQFIVDARKRGETWAYIDHHWEHVSVPLGRLQLATALAKLKLRELVDRRHPPDGGPRRWKIFYTWRVSRLRRHLYERQRRRNYERHGLCKLSNTADQIACSASEIQGVHD